jgi:hypothetical protein
MYESWQQVQKTESDVKHWHEMPTSEIAISSAQAIGHS